MKMLSSDRLFELRNEQKIITDVKAIDEHFHGGIATGKITELIGSSGTGKTQLCLRLCLNVQIPKDLGGLEGKALYIDTKRDFHPARLQELARKQEQRFLTRSWGTFSGNKMLQNVYYLHCPSTAQLMASILSLDKYFNLISGLKLIVVDSLAFPIRMMENVWDRTLLLKEMHSLLRQLLCKHTLAVVVTNELGYYRPRRRWILRPILGEHHTHLINERIWLTANGYYVGKKLKRRKLITECEKQSK